MVLTQNYQQDNYVLLVHVYRQFDSDLFSSYLQ